MYVIPVFIKFNPGKDALFFAHGGKGRLQTFISSRVNVFDLILTNNIFSKQLWAIDFI